MIRLGQSESQEAARRSNPQGNSLAVERFLWESLRGKRFRRYNFRKRFSFGVFILDFYSPKSKLAVEIVRDPRTFAKPDEYARRRREYIALYDIAIMHLTASELLSNPEAALSRIAEVARRRSESPVPLEQISSSNQPSEIQIVVPLD